MKLIVGCGPDYTKQSPDDVTLDFKAAFKPDIFFNVALGKKWPFEDNTFDEIEAFHVLEHIEGFKYYRKAMEEMYRILKPEGILRIKVPHRLHRSAYETADHVRFFEANSFHDFQTCNPYLEEMEYKTKFEQVEEFVIMENDNEPKEVNCVMKKVL